MKQKQRPVDNRIAETAPMTRVILVATFIQYVACPKLSYPEIINTPQ
jgi:hypothetical protein